MREDLTRQIIVARLREDLIGPGSHDEELTDLPTDRYLTGILFPPRTVFGPEDADEADTVDEDIESNTAIEAIPAVFAFRPSSAGLSFAVDPATDGVAGIALELEAATYEAKDGIDGGTRWKRRGIRVRLEELLEPTNLWNKSLKDEGMPGLTLHLRVKKWQGSYLVTVVLTNSSEIGERASRHEIEESTYFQVQIRVSAGLGSKIRPKPQTFSTGKDDPDARSVALIYRDIGEYAVGHTCSADWVYNEDGVSCVQTQWIPDATVKKARETGDTIFDNLIEKPETSPLNTKWLSDAPPDELILGLKHIPTLYGEWIKERRAISESLDPDDAQQAEIHLERCIEAADRMQAGIDLIRTDSSARTAFQAANRAMWMQDSWKKTRDGKDGNDLVWRPFQLAFVLLSLSSTSDGRDPNRGTMDLLWFPTGGGKTEAYLLLTAFTIFLRRIRAKGEAKGAGVAVFMRYTLRLLTIQQFQRAAAVVCACEIIRRGLSNLGVSRFPSHFPDDAPISIGLWVGQGSVPNKVLDAIEALKNEASATPKQISNCPVCHGKLLCKPSRDLTRIELRCTNQACDLGSLDAPLPIWSVDEDIYKILPTLMIGTADKYAQLTRNQDTRKLFGLGVNVDPPELIIQDELHLISGPLGTIAGIYEIAIDELCSTNGIRPKIIGSTATIRRADEQIRALFNRDAFQFPPPGIDHENSAFTSVDTEDPGRLYVGITTAGRSAKFTLQAVAASLLQSAGSSAIPDKHRDDYWTLVAYFNSLRELGGALVLMQDDVERSITDYAARRSEQGRNVAPPIELTSRVGSSEIPDLLERLELNCEHPDCVDSVLASNMISVGVDVSRLGLMLVNGQPKGISEYIQATSRVGRSGIPGLVITVYNANKARDRSRYESFANWHQSLYRDVEATSVTPFAARARDRALHAAFVAIVRHMIPGMDTEPVDARQSEKEIRAMIERITERAELIDPDEAKNVRSELNSFVDWWISRGRLKTYWDDWGNSGLLISAETAAERAASKRGIGSARATPNSLRSVEPSSAFILRPDRSRREEN